jgi:hypothetical protein
VHFFCNLQSRVRTHAVLVIDLYELLGNPTPQVIKLAHGRWFFPCTPTSSTTKTGRRDIAEILLKVALNTKIQIQIN